MKKADYKSLEVVAIYGLTNSAAIEVIRIDDDNDDEDEDRVYYDLATGTGWHPVRSSRIYFNKKGEPFFIAGKLGRVYLSECIRTKN